jgi:hypothetical protein
MTPGLTDGAQLMNEAIALRTRFGVNVAADWMQKQGIPRDLAVYALVRSGAAHHYGAAAVGVGQWGKHYADERGAEGGAVRCALDQAGDAPEPVERDVDSPASVGA